MNDGESAEEHCGGDVGGGAAEGAEDFCGEERRGAGAGSGDDVAVDDGRDVRDVGPRAGERLFDSGIAAEAATGEETP